MTPFALDHPAVSAYLQRLDAATAHLPEDERIEIQEGIRSHLIAALAEAHTDADMHQALDALGAPEEIVGTAAPGAAVAPPAAPPTQRASARGALEIIAVIFLLVGAFVVPFAGWVIGVVLLWLSKAWTTGEKWLGTLVVPGGLATSLLLTFWGGFLSVETCSAVGPPAPVVGRNGQTLDFTLPNPEESVTVCSGGVPPWLFVAIVAFLVIAPIVVNIYLLRVAGRRPAATA